jgi:hypothetical protein
MSMMRPGKPSSIEGIKRQAKRIKVERGLQHARALDEAAVLAGYQNFIHATRVLASKGTHAPGRETSTTPVPGKETPMSRADYQDPIRTAWIDAIASAAGSSTSSSVSWQDPSAIVRALSHITGEGRNHTFLPGGGGLDFEGVERSSEQGCIDFTIDGRVAYRVKPRRLILERIERDPAESFFMLELDTLEPSGVYPPREPREEFVHEELVELSRGGDYYPRHVWDEGETPDGRKLSSTARLVIRVLGGKVLFVFKGSLWNRNPATYDGRHAKMSPERIRGMIEGVLDAREARAASGERS